MVMLKANFLVKPAEQTAERQMSLSEFDQVAAITHVPTVYFYQTKQGYDFDSSCRVLKDSLSKALVTFYPLAGRLVLVSGDRFELHCNSMGVQFLTAESNSNIEDFGDFRPSSPKLHSLVPFVDYTKPISELPLLLIQLTKLDQNGICLGVALSHTVVDAISALHFVSELARICRGDERDSTYIPPLFDRTLLQAKEPLEPPSFEHLEYCDPPLLVGCIDAEEERREETTVARLNLSKEQTNQLVALANYGQINTDQRPYSKFEAFSAHIWRCLTKARNLNKNHNQLTRLYIPVDVRRRVEPKLPKGYFGNAVSRVVAESMATDLVSYPLSYGSSKIREAVSMVSDEYVRSSLRFLRSHKDLSELRISHAPGSIRGVFHGNPNMMINSWEKVPISDADFGWGKLIYMGLAAIGSDGKSLIMPSFDEDGAFTILLQMQIRYTEDFHNFFYQDISVETF